MPSLSAPAANVLTRAGNLAGLADRATARAHLDMATAAAIRSLAGLGSLATQNANAVTIVDGLIQALQAPLQLKDGGTEASTAAGARTKLGIEKLARRITVNSNSAGSASGSPGAETDLQTVTIPADTLDVNMASLALVVELQFAANANNKTIKAYLGSTQVYTSGAIAQNGGYCLLRVYIWRGSATNAEVFAVPDIPQGGVMPAGGIRTTMTLAGSGWAGAVNFKVTGQGTATNDVISRILDVQSVRNAP